VRRIQSYETHTPGAPRPDQEDEMTDKPKTKLSGREAITIVLADGKPRKSKEICAAAAALVTMKG
jgi:hypothetical protein